MAMTAGRTRAVEPARDMGRVSSDPSVSESVDDLLKLTELSTGTVLQALKDRFIAGAFYTDAGPMLIAINPNKSEENDYSNSVMEKYKEQEKATLTPHVFNVANDAHRAMMRRGQEDSVLAGALNQSIIVSGESGAGKTFTTTKLLSFFVQFSEEPMEKGGRVNGLIDPSLGSSGSSSPNVDRAPDNRRCNEDVGRIEQQVLQSNIILEAFGNARTSRNGNSSRFSKYVKLAFNSAGRLSGAKVETHLLEVNRAVHPPAKEGTFHIFYQLMVGLTDDERQELALAKLGPENFTLLKETAALRDVDEDKEKHRKMVQAMRTIGLEDGSVLALYQAVAFVLHCGNITFNENERTCSMGRCHSSLCASKLLGVQHDKLECALTQDCLHVGKEVITTELDKASSEKACEALMKAVYGAAFGEMVNLINKTTSQDFEGKHAFIALLDIFGFENFQHNSLDQFLINYTNELLQQKFNCDIFKSELEVYNNEGIPCEDIKFNDNITVLTLIANDPQSSILATLNSCCRFARSTERDFASALYCQHKENKSFGATLTQKANYEFSVKHYAGWVNYSTDGWLEKNNNQPRKGVVDLCQSSNLGFLTEKYQMGEDGCGTATKKSVCAEFVHQLTGLRHCIDSTTVHHIRCLKPNNEQTPDRFDEEMISHQLHCIGVVQALEASRAGYPIHMYREQFFSRYSPLNEKSQGQASRKGGKEGSEIKRLVKKITNDVLTQAKEDKDADVTVDNPQESLSLDFPGRCKEAGLVLGRTKVLLRQKTYNCIEAALHSQKLAVCAVAIQRIFRGAQARKAKKLRTEKEREKDREKDRKTEREGERGRGGEGETGRRIEHIARVVQTRKATGGTQAVVRGTSARAAGHNTASPPVQSLGQASCKGRGNSIEGDEAPPAGGKLVGRQEAKRKPKKRATPRAGETGRNITNINQPTGYKPWAQSFNELVSYKKMHGNTNVPRKFGPLGRWVKGQRELFRDGSMGDDRVKKLREIGFDFKEAGTCQTWQESFDQLVLYKQEHGHTNVPQRFGHLGSWVKYQRAQCKKFTQNQSCHIDEEKLQKLKGIGFTFTVKG